MKFRIMEETRGSVATFFIQRKQLGLWWDVTFYDAEVDYCFRHEFSSPTEAFSFIQKEFCEVKTRVVQEIHK